MSCSLRTLVLLYHLLDGQLNLSEKPRAVTYNLKMLSRLDGTVLILGNLESLKVSRRRKMIELGRLKMLEEDAVMAGAQLL